MKTVHFSLVFAMQIHRKARTWSKVLLFKKMLTRFSSIIDKLAMRNESISKTFRIFCRYAC